MGVYEENLITWKGQEITVRWCADWSREIAHLEIVTEDRKAHPISETGYKSHFLPRQQVEELDGPVAYVTRWLEELDDGKAVQLSLF